MHRLEAKKSGEMTTLIFIAGLSALFLMIGLAVQFWAFILCGGAVILFTFFFLFKIFMRNQFIAPPEIYVSTLQARLGEVINMNYHQLFKRDVQVNKLSFRLILREWVQYQRGTDTVTETHDHVIDEFGYPGRVFKGGEELRDEWSFQIPANSIHTFKASNNRLQWFVQVDIDMKSWSDLKQDYEIQVLPQKI